MTDQQEQSTGQVAQADEGQADDQSGKTGPAPPLDPGPTPSEDSAAPTDLEPTAEHAPETADPEQQQPPVPEPEDAPDASSEQIDPLENEDSLPDLAGILVMAVPVIVKIAEKKMSMAEVLKLNVGSIITFNKDAYDSIELMVNNRTIALGQPVKIGENFGLRVVEIFGPAETINVLGGNPPEGA